MKSEEQISLNEEGQLACDVKSRNRTRPGHFWNARDLNSAPNCAPQSMNFLGWEIFSLFLINSLFYVQFQVRYRLRKKNFISLYLPLFLLQIEISKHYSAVGIAFLKYRHCKWDFILQDGLILNLLSWWCHRKLLLFEEFGNCLKLVAEKSWPF